MNWSKNLTNFVPHSPFENSSTCIAIIQSPALIEVAKLKVALIKVFNLIPALPEYKTTVFYGQGIKTAKGHCTIMSFLYNYFDCTPLPYFSNPNLSFDEEKLGDVIGDLKYNVKWIRENRLLLKAVGTENKICKFTEGSLDGQENTDTKCLIEHTL